MYDKYNNWAPLFAPGHTIKTQFNTIVIDSVHSEQVYNVEIIGDHGLHVAKMTESFLKDMENIYGS